jgi:hypothetical protein
VITLLNPFIKVAIDLGLYVGSSLYVSDDPKIEAVFQSLDPSFDASVLTSHSG